MEHIIAGIPGWVVKAIVGLVGIGIGWGMVKSEIHILKDKQAKQEEKISTIVEKTDCTKFREDCRESIRDQLVEVKVAVEANRKIVLDKFDEIMQFMGYVKGKIEDYNGRLR